MALVKDKANALVRSTRQNLGTLGSAVGLLWVVHVVNAVMFAGNLAAFGIHPRQVSGLIGIFFSPFLHASFAHLAVNTVSFLILGGLTIVRRRSDFAAVTLGGMLASGLGAWLLGGAGTVHIGASGVIFAYLGFLMTRGWFERSWGSIALSLLVIWAFGGMVFGVLPTVGAAISWQAHLFGFVGGIGVARLLGRAPKAKQVSGSAG